MKLVAVGLSLLMTLASGQSFFNTHGLGEIVPPADARNTSLGAQFAFSYRNPGMLVTLPQVSFGVTSLAAGALGTESGRSRFIGTVRPSGFTAAAPLPVGFKLSLGMDNVFNQDFDVWSDSASDSSYRYHVSGRGGIYGLRAGLSYSLFNTACVGLGYTRLIGGSREDWRFEVGNGQYVSTDTVELDCSGNALCAGLSVQTRRFSFAALYEPAVSMNAVSVHRVHGIIKDSTKTYRLGLPFSLSGAAGFKPFERAEFTLGAEYRPWTQFSVNDTVDDLWYNNVLRLSGGFEFLPTDKLSLRLGYSRQTLYFGSDGEMEPEPVPVSEQAVHLGAGLPIPQFGSLNFGAEVVLRSNGYLTETCGRLSLTLAYHEAWLKRTRRWGY